MELRFFQDKLFDVINESDELDVADLEWNEKSDLLKVTMQDGSAFGVLIKPAEASQTSDRQS